MSWKPAIKTGSDDWSYNAQCFETKDEAMTMARDIFSRWMLATDYKAIESDEPVNCKLENNVLTSVTKEEA